MISRLYISDVLRKILRIHNEEIHYDLHKVVRLFGVRIFKTNHPWVLKRAFKRRKVIRIDPKSDYAEVEQYKHIQDGYEYSVIRRAKKIILVMIPAENTVYGGMMSMFSIGSHTRQLVDGDVPVCLCTVPRSYFGVYRTFSHNTWFKNDELIYRLSNFVEHATSCEELIVHLPEICIGHFVHFCHEKHVAFLQSLKSLQINILLQNIDLMPNADKVRELYKFTSHITATTAHKKYTSQQVADAYQFPVKYIGVALDLSNYIRYQHKNKEKMIMVSRDKCPEREVVLARLQEMLPDYRFVLITSMHFDDYMSYIGRAMCTISFGEGFDGYVMQPPLVGGVGVTVYNDRFFPDASWLDLPNIWQSWEALCEELPGKIREWERDEDAYGEIVRTMHARHDAIYFERPFLEYLQEFYEGKFDYYPEDKGAGT